MHLLGAMSAHEQIGEAVVGAIIIGSFIVQQWKARKRAEEVKNVAKVEAAAVALVAKREAASVAEKLEASGAETSRQLQEIHVMVDGRLDQALVEMHALREEIDNLKGDPPGTAASEAGPDVLLDDLTNQ